MPQTIPQAVPQAMLQYVSPVMHLPVTSASLKKPLPLSKPVAVPDILIEKLTNIRMTLAPLHNGRTGTGIQGVSKWSHAL